MTLVTPGGELQGKAAATVLHPDKLKLVLALPVGEFVQVYDGTAAWMRMGPQPPNELPAAMHVELQRSTYQNGQKVAELVISEWRIDTGVSADFFSKEAHAPSRSAGATSGMNPSGGVPRRP